jgi:transposase-like protein
MKFLFHLKLYSMTTRDIQSHVEEIYGLDISPTTISKITDSIVVHAKEWQSRPLNEIYPKAKIIIGGAAVNQQFADEIGADAYGRDAIDTVKKIEELMRK